MNNQENEKEKEDRQDTCSTCRYAQKLNMPGILIYFQCRRYAPSPSSSEVSYWPEVKDTDWCGEYSARIDLSVITIEGERLQ